ncbi:FK506-binding protein-like [Protopterus annectens]|uniref:FK506-binding protein-like n=1 Tax=Protopterus annectens TaxID=7888 RepID=UPI001CF98917|nr:FK506-binding protein-like [Protopterus annectens]
MEGQTKCTYVLSFVPNCSTKTWKSPDGTFTKKVLEPGSGLDKPRDGSQCCIFIDNSLKDASSVEVNFPYTVNQWVNIILGESDTECGVILDKCLETMLRGEKSLVLVKHATSLHPLSCNQSEFTFAVHLADFSQVKDSWEMSFEEKWDLIIKDKEKGSENFKAGNIFGACRRYGRALKYLVTLTHYVPAGMVKEYGEMMTVLYLNLAACQIKLCQYGHVIQNCSKALELSPGNVKGLYRRGQAYTFRNEFEKAKDDLKNVLQLEPGNRAACQQIKILENKIRAQDTKLAKAMSKLFS